MNFRKIVRLIDRIMQGKRFLKWRTRSQVDAIMKNVIVCDEILDEEDGVDYDAEEVSNEMRELVYV